MHAMEAGESSFTAKGSVNADDQGLNHQDGEMEISKELNLDVTTVKVRIHHT